MEDRDRVRSRVKATEVVPCPVSFPRQWPGLGCLHGLLDNGIALASVVLQDDTREHLDPRKCVPSVTRGPVNSQMFTRMGVSREWERNVAVFFKRMGRGSVACPESTASEEWCQDLAGQLPPVSCGHRGPCSHQGRACRCLCSEGL